MTTHSSPLTNIPADGFAPSSESTFLKTALSPEAIAARRSMHELGKLSLGEQCDAARVIVEIGGVKTFWSRGFSSVPPSIELSRGGERLLLVWNEADSSLHIFKRTAEKPRYERVQIVAKHSLIFSHLPRYAFVPGRCGHTASLAQLVTLRNLLGLDPSMPIPDLHISSARRIISSIILEPFLKRQFGEQPVNPAPTPTPAAPSAATAAAETV